MKYRFYITDIFNGKILGTNSETVARELSQSEEYFVVDTQSNVWFNVNGEDLEIEEFWTWFLLVNRI